MLHAFSRSESPPGLKYSPTLKAFEFAVANSPLSLGGILLSDLKLELGLVDHLIKTGPQEKSVFKKENFLSFILFFLSKHLPYLMTLLCCTFKLRMVYPDKERR